MNFVLNQLDRPSLKNFKTELVCFFAMNVDLSLTREKS